MNSRNKLPQILHSVITLHFYHLSRHSIVIVSYSLNFFIMFLSSFCQSSASLSATGLFLWMIFVFIWYLIFFIPPEQSQKTLASVLKVARQGESAFHFQS